MEYEEYWAQEYLRQKNIAQQAPVRESEYHIKRIKNMSLYDCLVPRLKVLKKPSKPKGSAFDSEWDTFEELIAQNDYFKNELFQKKVQVRILESKV